MGAIVGTESQTGGEQARSFDKLRMTVNGEWLVVNGRPVGSRFYISGRTFSTDLSAPISLAATLREASAARIHLEVVHISIEEALREALARLTPLEATHISLEETLREASAALIPLAAVHISLEETLREASAALIPLAAVHISLEETLIEASATLIPLAAVHISLEETLLEASAILTHLAAAFISLEEMLREASANKKPPKLLHFGGFFRTVETAIFLLLLFYTDYLIKLNNPFLFITLPSFNVMLAT